jgi:asparagine synthase (glutamine-hydrolysing)
MHESAVLDILDFHDLLQGYSNEAIAEKLQTLDALATKSLDQVLSDKSDDECVVSFSGGIDSSILAHLIGVSKRKVTLLSVGKANAADIVSLSEFKNQRKEVLLDISSLDVEKISSEAKRLASLLDGREVRVAHFEDCLAFLLIGEEMMKLKPRGRFIVTANGPDELFCGYDRFRRIMDHQGEAAIEKEIPHALQEAVALKSVVNEILKTIGLSTLDPFLTSDFIDYACLLPVNTKILKGDDRLRKRLWRAYGRYLGLDERVVLKPKKAMQYSMGIHAVVEKMMRNQEIIVHSAQDRSRTK